MAVNYTALHTVALISQMFMISIHLPARVINAVEQELPELHGPQVDGYRFQQYLNRNQFVAILGLVPVLVAWLSDFESSMTLILLTTGLYFFLQVATLIAARGVLSLFSVGRVVPQQVSRPLVVGAVVAYIAYLATSVIYQNEAATTQWAKIQIITLANAFFVFTVVASLVSMRRASTTESRVRGQEVGRSINVLASISIGLSVYFFGKEVLADLDLVELRPLMMSVFLQALMLLTVHAQFGTSISNPTRPFRHVDSRG
ncbi:MAG: hypothetical protein QNL12_13505 [Acidimicrobiia bacterium]|nr:hypothetical protein [Acidimicrobiia bacterium]